MEDSDPLRGFPTQEGSVGKSSGASSQERAKVEGDDQEHLLVLLPACL